MRKILFFLFTLTTVKSNSLTSVDLSLNNNVTVFDIKSICLLNFTVNDVSENCQTQLDIVCKNATIWLTMLDASSRFPYSGVGYSSRSDYGNVDQCLTIDHNYDGGRILGKHCSAGLLIPDISNPTNLSAYFRLAVCKPDACSAEDYITIAQQYIPEFPPLFQDQLCVTKETTSEYSTLDIITIFILAVCIFMMVMCTTYDIYLYKMQQKSRHPLFLAFSVFANGRKLLQVSNGSKEQIQPFLGIKVISMMWILAGHNFLSWALAGVTNFNDMLTWDSHRYSVYIFASYLGVDTFFYMSGFLMAYQLLKQRTRSLKSQILSVPQAYLHRYLRLTPAVLMMYLVGMSIYHHLGSGPLYEASLKSLERPCRTYWWSFFLYIQNYYNYDNICFTHTWYLSADMQMYLLSPLVLIPISLQLKMPRGFRKVMVELLLLNLFCTVLPIAVKLSFRDYTNQYDTHSRLINYFIGMMMGVFMRIKKDKPFLPMVHKDRIAVINFALWVATICAMLAVVIGYKEIKMINEYVGITLYDSLMRPIWCMGLCWIIYSSFHGYGGIVSWFLGCSLFQVLSKLTYTMYIMHVHVIIYPLLTIRSKWYFTDYNVFYSWCGHFMVTLLVALFWTLAFESPLIVIEKFIFGKGERKQEKSIPFPPTNEYVEEAAKKC